MLEKKTIKEALNNMYELIKTYEKEIYEKKEKRSTEKIEHYHEKYQQKYLDFQISIYKNIEKKLLPFTELFNLENETPYMLDSRETEILRQYIGLYTNGKQEYIKEISKTFSCTERRIKTDKKNIIESFMNPNVQEQIITERNLLIKENIKNKNLKEQILNSPIEMLVMTDNFLQILKINNIKTINDLINMDLKKLQRINIGYGYNPDMISFPKRIIDEIHNMGLYFIKLDNEFKELYKIDAEIPKEFIEQIKIQEHTKNIKTILDLINAQQFEPEIINALNLRERLKIDENINSSYRQIKYIDMIEETHRNILDKISKTYKKEITPKEIIRILFPYMIDEEIEIAISQCSETFEINNETDEHSYKLKKTQFTNKN